MPVTSDSPSTTVSTAWRSRRGKDSYDGIEPSFAELATLDPGGRRHLRLREDIITRTLPLAEHIARRYTGRGFEFDDLLQVAREGLLGAVDRFDPARGATFVGFAVPTIMGAIRRCFRDQGWAVSVPRGLKDLRIRITAITPDLAQRLDRMPTPGDLADALDVDREQIARALIAADCYRTESLDSPVATGEGGTALTETDFLGADEPCYGLLEDAMTVRPLLDRLPARDREILVERFFAGRTQADIGAQYGVSQMQIHRILSRVLHSLREQALPAG